MAVRNRALAWLQASIALAALAGAAVLTPVSTAHANEPIDTTPSASTSATPSASAPATPSATQSTTAPATTAPATTAPATTTAAAPATTTTEPTADMAAAATYPVGDVFAATYQASVKVLGAATSALTALPGGGAKQTFVGGTVFYSPTTGSHVVRAGFLAYYTADGQQAGALGYPVGSEQAGANGGTMQQFQGGKLYWYPDLPITSTRFGFGSFHDALGGVGGQLGYPTTNEQPARNGGTVQHFQNGILWWSPTSGTVMTTAAFGTYYAMQGQEWGVLGYPISNEQPRKDGGSVQWFQGGALWWTGTGVHMTKEGFHSAYEARGAEWGFLGYPTSDEQWNGSAIVQQFQGGTMYYDMLGTSVTRGVRAVEWGYTQLGKPYATGGTGPNAYDCSGFTQAAFAAVGVSIPRTSYSQPAAGIPVPFSALQPGDLVFTYGYGHVGIYVGDGKIINSLNYGIPLSISPMYGGFNGAVRVLS